MLNRSGFQIVSQDTLGFHGSLSMKKNQQWVISLPKWLLALLLWIFRCNTQLITGCTLGSCKTQKALPILNEQTVRPENVPEPSSTMHRSSAADRQKFLSRHSNAESIPWRWKVWELSKRKWTLYQRNPFLLLKVSFLIMLTVPLGS